MGVRASDAERERTVASLRRAYAAGRLRLEDLEQRITRAYEATWRGELRVLTRDLPFEMTIDRRRVVRGMDRFQRAMFRLHAWAFVSFNTVLVAMWSWGGGHEFWPALSIVPGGALLAWHRKGSVAASRKLGTGREERRGRRAIAA
jgi:hypothetical protein